MDIKKAQKLIKKTGDEKKKIERKLKQAKNLASNVREKVDQGKKAVEVGVQQGQKLIEQGKQAVKKKLQQLKEVPKQERVKEISQIVLYIKQNFNSLQGNTVEEKIKNGIMSA